MSDPDDVGVGHPTSVGCYDEDVEMLDVEDHSSQRLPENSWGWRSSEVKYTGVSGWNLSEVEYTRVSGWASLDPPQEIPMDWEMEPAPDSPYGQEVCNIFSSLDNILTMLFILATACSVHKFIRIWCTKSRVLYGCA